MAGFLLVIPNIQREPEMLQNIAPINSLRQGGSTDPVAFLAFSRLMPRQTA